MLPAIALSMSSSVGLRHQLQECCRRHDLPGLAVAALRHVERRPRRLHRLGLRAVDAFYRHHVRALDHRDRRHARPPRHPVEMHGAGAALRDAAAVLGAGQPGVVADDPEQRRVRIAVEAARRAVEGEVNHASLPGVQALRLARTGAATIAKAVSHSRPSSTPLAGDGGDGGPRRRANREWVDIGHTGTTPAPDFLPPPPSSWQNTPAGGACTDVQARTPPPPRLETLKQTLPSGDEVVTGILPIERFQRLDPSLTRETPRFSGASIAGGAGNPARRRRPRARSDLGAPGRQPRQNAAVKST